MGAHVVGGKFEVNTGIYLTEIISLVLVVVPVVGVVVGGRGLGAGAVPPVAVGLVDQLHVTLPVLDEGNQKQGGPTLKETNDSFLTSFCFRAS